MNYLLEPLNEDIKRKENNDKASIGQIFTLDSEVVEREKGAMHVCQAYSYIVHVKRL